MNTIRFIIRAIRHSGSSGKVMGYNHNVYAGWCSYKHRPLCETSAPPPLGDDRIISRHFPTSWPPKVYRFQPLRLLIVGLPQGLRLQRKHKMSCASHSLVHAAFNSRFLLPGGSNGGQHIDHVLLTFVHYLYVLNKAMIRHLRWFLKLIVFFPL
ncbi:hypothetical protein TNCV_3935231 [Trichonephila clavipes]|nr:hypothetical protein TNCV_3935231 [Trichonephila clavipes]